VGLLLAFEEGLGVEWAGFVTLAHSERASQVGENVLLGLLLMRVLLISVDLGAPGELAEEELVAGGGGGLPEPERVVPAPAHLVERTEVVVTAAWSTVSSLSGWV
jgi:hypothetical protein